MDCPHCSSAQTDLRLKTTRHGYRIFFCRSCQRQFNERTLSPFNRLQYPTDVVFSVVLWRLRDKLSFRDLAEIFLQRGITFTHETVRQWEANFAALLTDDLKKARKGTANTRWRVGETKLKIGKEWHYLYRAIDSDGVLVDIRLSKVRSLETTEAFFRQAVETVGHTPTQVTTDKESSYPTAIERVAGRKVEHRTLKALNNKLEQDHRGIKSRYRPMKGFKTAESAARFCAAFEEQRAYLRQRRRHSEVRGLGIQRVNLTERVEQLREAFVNKKMVWRQAQLSIYHEVPVVTSHQHRINVLKTES